MSKIEKPDRELIAITEMMVDHLRLQIINGNIYKPVTITFDPTKYWYLCDYLSNKTGAKL